MITPLAHLTFVLLWLSRNNFCPWFEPSIFLFMAYDENSKVNQQMKKIAGLNFIYMLWTQWLKHSNCKKQYCNTVTIHWWAVRYGAMVFYKHVFLHTSIPPYHGILHNVHVHLSIMYNVHVHVCVYVYTYILHSQTFCLLYLCSAFKFDNFSVKQKTK